jgi:hypothetical protein
MAASDASSDRYDPWYVKVAFGLFLSALVGFLAVLYGLPATQRASELRSGRAHPRRTPRAGVKMNVNAAEMPSEPSAAAEREQSAKH